MNAGHILSIILVLAVQWFLLAAGGTATGAFVALPLLILALLLPVPGYVWALRDAPLGVRSPRRAVRMTIVGFAAIGLSLVGFILGLIFFGSRVRGK